MNLTYSPARRTSRARVARPAAVAILYPKVGNVLRVPLRRTRTGGTQGCAQHPERQFIRWFNRMAAARPAFPLQVKSILLLTGEPLCESCRRVLNRYLGQYQLASKLRVRSRGEACDCGCGGQCSSAGPNDTTAQLTSSLLLDDLISNTELEEEGWWNRAKDLGRAALLTGALALGPQGVSKPVYDVAKAVAGAYERRRKTQQTVDDNTPPNRRPPGQQELEFECEVAGAACPNPGPARPTLRLGARSDYVRYLQCRLNYQHANLTLPLVEDGVWGPKTQEAVRGFQQSKGLVVDAVVGPLTWAKLDEGNAGPAVVPPSPPPGGQPGTTDLTLVRFRNANDINAFFRAKTGQDFIDWFRAKVGGRGAWTRTWQGQSTAVTMPADADTRAGFQQFWDGIPLVFKTADINFAQFAALQSILINETGGRMRPIAEKVGTTAHPGIAYAFDRIAGLKSSYNVSPNKTALALFNDNDFIQAHGQKALGNRLARTQDARWGGVTYPSAEFPTSTDPAIAGFVQEADFYKFRGRGYIQITWRNAYQWLIPSVQNYAGSDPVILRFKAQWQGLSLDAVATRSGNADWDALFMQSPAFALGALKIFFGHKKDSINKVQVNDWPSVRAVACDVMCTASYQNLFEQRVRQIFDTLGATPVGPNPGSQPGPSKSVLTPVPATGRTENELREAIIANALRMMAAPEIHAKLRGPDGFRVGWEKLKAIFQLAAPAYVIPGWEENSLKRSTAISNNAGIPDWCAIFPVWAIKAAGLPVGNWPIGGPLGKVKGFRQIGVAQLKKGDVGFIEKNWHHFLIKEVHPDGTVDTIEGNSGLDSTVRLNKRNLRDKTSVLGGFTAF